MSDQAQPAVVVGLIVLFGLLSSLYFGSDVLESERPDAQRDARHRIFGSEEGVPARLWQDPFDAVSRAREREAIESRKKHLDTIIETAADQHAVQLLLRPDGNSAFGSGSVESPRKNNFETKRGAKEKSYDDYIGEIRGQIVDHAARLRRSGDEVPRITVLGVSVFGGPYVGDREFRLRSRYAVVSALKHVDLVPENNQHIGFFLTDPGYALSDTGSALPGIKEVIPYEWFVPVSHFDTIGPSETSTLLLLWIKEEFLRSRPLKRISKAISALCPEREVRGEWLLCSVPEEPDKRILLRFRLVGPAGSAALQEMVRDVCRTPRAPDLCINREGLSAKSGPPVESGSSSADPNLDVLKSLKIISPTASASWEQLASGLTLVSEPVVSEGAEAGETLKRPDDTINGDGSVQYGGTDNGDKGLIARFKDTLGITFRRAVLSDDQIVRALLNELCLRGVRVPCADREPATRPLHPEFGQHDHIVLVSEWDSQYGRTLTQQFDHQFHLGLQRRLADELETFKRLSMRIELGSLFQKIVTSRTASQFRSRLENLYRQAWELAKRDEILLAFLEQEGVGEEQYRKAYGISPERKLEGFAGKKAANDLSLLVEALEGAENGRPDLSSALLLQLGKAANELVVRREHDRHLTTAIEAVAGLEAEIARDTGMGNARDPGEASAGTSTLRQKLQDRLADVVENLEPFIDPDRPFGKFHEDPVIDLRNQTSDWDLDLAESTVAATILASRLDHLATQFRKASTSSDADPISEEFMELATQVAALEPIRGLASKDLDELGDKLNDLSERAAETFSAGRRTSGDGMKLVVSLQRMAKLASSNRPHHFAYMRGLDGSTAGQLKPSRLLESDDKRSDLGHEQRDRAEAAVGDDQLDYLQRMGTKIAALDSKLWRDPTPDRDHRRERVRAIGILGSDFYDKLLILRALRQRFPSMLFFTLDLDAGFLDPSRSSWTRNLIVGSTFGLRLSQAFQGSTPPFRNSHQTSYYLAALAALDRVEFWRPPDPSLSCDDKVGDRLLFGQAIRPTTFEVGRSEEIQLTDARELSDTHQPFTDTCVASVDEAVPQVTWIDKSEKLRDYSWIIWTIAGFLALLMLLVNPSRMLWLFKPGFGSIALVGISFAGLVLYIGTVLPIEGQNQEPFSWTRGVSVWPSEIIRVLTGILVVGLFLYAWDSLKNANRKMADLLEKGRHSRSINDSTVEWLRGILSDYEKLSSPSRRISLVLCSILMFWALSLWLVILLGYEVQPIRGQVAMNFDAVSEFIVGGLLFLGLLFFVLDTVGINMRVMKRVREGCTGIEPCRIVAASSNEVGRVGVQDDELLKVEFVAELTSPISKMLTYPFITLFLLVVAKSTYFDNWTFPMAYRILLGVLLLFIFAAAIVVRLAAEEIRKESLSLLVEHAEKIKDAALSAEAEKATEKTRLDLTREHARDVCERISNMTEGAFHPWHQQAALRIVFWVLASMSALGLESVLG